MIRKEMVELNFRGGSCGGFEGIVSLEQLKFYLLGGKGNKVEQEIWGQVNEGFERGIQGIGFYLVGFGQFLREFILEKGMIRKVCQC